MEIVFMKLNNVLKGKYTAEEYLAHQREMHKARCEKFVEKRLRLFDNPEHLAEYEEAAIHAMQNMFVLPGSGGVRMHVGTPPKWSECLTDDEEYLWHLNRMGYFKTLSDLYHFKGESAYAEKVLFDMENWIDTCPMYELPSETTTCEEMQQIRKFYSGLTPWRSLEVGIRMFDSWNYAYDSLLFSDLMTPELHAKIAYSFYEHALVLRKMSPIYWPNANHNHYIHEMLGLFEIACLFPDFDESDAWREFALAELLRCAKAQFTADGGQIEGSPHYHYCCLKMFFDFLEAARGFGVTVCDEIINICKLAVDYMLAVLGPDGIVAPMGDSPYHAVGDHVAEYYYSSFGELGATAKVFAIHADDRLDTIPEEVQAQAREYAKNAPGEDNRQRQINQYFARTGWGRDDSSFGFICHSPIFNGHAHQDLMSFILYLKGDPVVVDPSYFTYRDCDERRRFKSPEYHSTLTFDDKLPFDYIDRWRYGPQREGGVRGFYKSAGIYAVDASHHCYDPDYHKRLCALIDDDVFIVADDVANITETDVRIYFHMDDSTVTICGGEARSERIRVLLPEGVLAECVESEKSLHTDITVPSSRLILTDTAHKSRQYLTVFTKRDDLSEPKISRTADGVKISYKQGGEEKSFLWSFSSYLKRL